MTAYTVINEACVVAGRLNPAIIVPSWLVREGILPDGEVEIVSALGRSFEGYSMGGLHWRASLIRLEVFADGPSLLAPGIFAARILERLVHTPVTAIGNNFVYGLTEEQGARLASLVSNGLAAGMSEHGHKIASYSVEVVSPQDDGALVKLSVTTEDGSVSDARVNIHREVVSASDGAEAAQRWSDDKDLAAAVLDRILS